jgi:hypothetical protein
MLKYLYGELIGKLVAKSVWQFLGANLHLHKVPIYSEVYMKILILYKPVFSFPSKSCLSSLITRPREFN